MPTPKQQRRRALELLEASIDSCTEAIMRAYGFKTELLVELVNAELGTSTIERMVISGRARRRAGQTGIADDYLLHCDSSPKFTRTGLGPRHRREDG
jgi:hypothetical protein